MKRTSGIQRLLWGSVFCAHFATMAQAPAAPVIVSLGTSSEFGGFAGTAAPGSYIEIQGANLAGTIREWTDSDFTGGAAPTSLDGVTVSINGEPAFVSFVSPEKVNAQVPDDIPTGGTVPVVVNYQDQSSDPADLAINPVEPGLRVPESFKVNGRQYVAAVHATDGTFVSTGGFPDLPPAPAMPSEVLIFYGTGFGPVQQGPVAGQIASAPVELASTFTMTIGNAPAIVQYAGLTVGLVGIYQFTVKLPGNLPGGDQPVQMTLNGSPITLQNLFLPVGGPPPPPHTNVVATPGDGSASIAFQPPPPPPNGGPPFTGFTATCTAGDVSITATASASPIVVNGLTNGTTYSCVVTASSGGTVSAPYAAVTVTPRGVAAPGSFTLTSAAGVDGGTLPSDYTCDGMGATIPLAWANPPAGTKEFALLMTTLPGDGTTKWNWVLYGIPGTTKNLQKDSFLVGTLGVGSDGPGTVYNPPCSQGPGLKLYTYTLYALSAPPVFTVPANQVNGQIVTDAIKSITLGSASLSLGSARSSTASGSSPACAVIRNSTRASKSGVASVSCDDTYAYVGSNGITTQPMMNGITSTNLQVPTPQNFNGANAWKIPVNPTIAPKPTDVADGPIGVAINGVPIFNPCTQGGCVTGGDTKALGQLDTCNGHAGRADDYHYHAAPNCMMADQPPNYWDTHPLGWALDGFAIFGYNDADGSVAARDAICGGNTKPVPNAPAGYSYHVTDAAPYVSSCLIGVPSPDLPNQASKYHPIRQPPVTPFNNTGMTLTADMDGYEVLQFTSARPFNTTETGQDSYPNPPGTYKIRYKQVAGDALITLLATQRNANATACWTFEFIDSSGKTTQPTVSYCR